MTREENFIQKGKCENNDCSSLSKSAWCDLNSKGDILKLHDKFPNPQCNCQKIITFTTHQYLFEGGSIESKLQKIFKGTQAAWNKYSKPAVNVAAPFIGMAVGPKAKNPSLLMLLQLYFEEYISW